MAISANNPAAIRINGEISQSVFGINKHTSRLFRCEIFKQTEGHFAVNDSPFAFILGASLFDE